MKAPRCGSCGLCGHNIRTCRIAKMPWWQQWAWHFSLSPTEEQVIFPVHTAKYRNRLSIRKVASR